MKACLRCLDKPATAEEGFDPLQSEFQHGQVPPPAVNTAKQQPVPLAPSFIALLEGRAFGGESHSTMGAELQLPGDVRRPTAG